MTQTETGYKDSNGGEICEGDWVSLDGNMTADDSMGVLPNGFEFTTSDVYEVFFDRRINDWSLQIPVELDSEYNVKYLNHAVSLLHSGMVKLVNK